jgi:hypothetical protein
VPQCSCEPAHRPQYCSPSINRHDGHIDSLEYRPAESVLTFAAMPDMPRSAPIVTSSDHSPRGGMAASSPAADTWRVSGFSMQSHSYVRLRVTQAGLTSFGAATRRRKAQASHGSAVVAPETRSDCSSSSRHRRTRRTTTVCGFTSDWPWGRRICRRCRWPCTARPLGAGRRSTGRGRRLRPPGERHR